MWEIAGGIGVGLVWGWLLVLLLPGRAAQRRLASLTALLGASVLAIGQVAVMVEATTASVFVVGVSLSALAHAGWRRYLQMRRLASE